MGSSWLVVAVGALLLSGCAGTGAAGQVSGVGSATVTPEPATMGTGSGSTLADDSSSGRPVAVSSGLVTVALKLPVTSTMQVIEATVANGTTADIYVQDLRTGCSVAVLERAVSASANSWQALADCGSERVARTLRIAPGHGRDIRIDPAGLAAEGQPLRAGTYRLVVTLTSGDADKATSKAVSSPFSLT